MQKRQKTELSAWARLPRCLLACVCKVLGPRTCDAMNLVCWSWTSAWAPETHPRQIRIIGSKRFAQPSVTHERGGLAVIRYPISHHKETNLRNDIWLRALFARSAYATVVVVKNLPDFTSYLPALGQLPLTRLSISRCVLRRRRHKTQFTELCQAHPLLRVCIQHCPMVNGSGWSPLTLLERARVVGETSIISSEGVHSLQTARVRALHTLASQATLTRLSFICKDRVLPNFSCFQQIADLTLLNNTMKLSIPNLKSLTNLRTFRLIGGSIALQSLTDKECRLEEVSLHHVTITADTCPLRAGTLKSVTLDMCAYATEPQSVCFAFWYATKITLREPAEHVRPWVEFLKDDSALLDMDVCLVAPIPRLNKLLLKALARLTKLTLVGASLAPDEQRAILNAVPRLFLRNVKKSARMQWLSQPGSEKIVFLQ